MVSLVDVDICSIYTLGLTVVLAAIIALAEHNTKVAYAASPLLGYGVGLWCEGIGMLSLCVGSVFNTIKKRRQPCGRPPS